MDIFDWQAQVSEQARCAAILDAELRALLRTAGTDRPLVAYWSDDDCGQPTGDPGQTSNAGQSTPDAGPTTTAWGRPIHDPEAAMASILTALTGFLDGDWRAGATTT